VERGDVLRKVQALLDKADATSFPEEADALRQKADDMMLAWAIQEHELDQARPVHERRKPGKRIVHVCGPNSVIREQLADLLAAISLHSRCRIVFHGLDRRFKDRELTSTVVGYESDLDYVEMLFTSLRVQMATKLEPKPDPNLSFEDNLVIMKEAGMKWQRIHALLCPDTPWERRHGVRYTGIYTNFCKRHEKSRMYTAPGTYSKNFALGFVSEINRRLSLIRKQQESDHGPMDIVLYDAANAVNQAFQDAFPNLRTAAISKYKMDGAAFNQGVGAGSRADLGQTRMAPRRELG